MEVAEDLEAAVAVVVMECEAVDQDPMTEWEVVLHLAEVSVLEVQA